MAGHEYKDLGCKRPENSTERSRKMRQKDEMVLKKRRNVSRFGCMGDLNEYCSNLKLRRVKIEEIC